MTNLTTVDLSTLNLKDLQTLAKEFKVKSWWTMKKADLVISLEGSKVLQQKARESQERRERESNQEDQEESQDKAPKARKPRPPKVEKDQDNLVTLKDLAAEFGMKGTKARRLLRNETAARPYGGNRWEWDKKLHKESLEAARSILKAHTK